MKVFLVIGSLVVIVLVMAVLMSCLRISAEANDMCNQDI